jgi:hypothetical protein
VPADVATAASLAKIFPSLVQDVPPPVFEAV